MVIKRYSLILCAFFLFYFAVDARAVVIPELSYRVTNTYTLDQLSFTQGLYLDSANRLYISSGLYQHSFIKSYDFPTFDDVSYSELETHYFAEGLTVIDNILYLCTWKAKKCFSYEAATFKKLATFDIETEGWGLTHNDKNNLILSDGSNRLYVLDKDTFILPPLSSGLLPP